MRQAVHRIARRCAWQRALVWFWVALLTVVGRGDADILVVFERELKPGGDVDLFGRWLDINGVSLDDQDQPMATSEWAEQRPMLLPAPQGGAYLLYSARALQGDWQGDIDLAAQRLDRRGQPVWNDGRPALVADSPLREDGAVVVPHPANGFLAFFELFFPEGDYAGDTDLVGQRLSRDGEKVWQEGQRSLFIAGSQWREGGVSAVPDGQGGAIVFCEVADPKGDDVDILGQRVDEDGHLLWGGRAEGLPVAVASATQSERHPLAVADGKGGCYLIFEIESRNEADGTTETDLYAQRFRPNGEPLWNAGVPLPVARSLRGSERNAAAIADGKGVTVVYEFEFTRGEHAGDVDLLAMRLSERGEIVWDVDQLGPMSASDNWLERAPVLCPDGRGGWYVIFEAEVRFGPTRGDVDLYAQRLDAEGTMHWDDVQAVAASTWEECRPVVMPDGQDGVIIVFEARSPDGKDVDVWAQRLASDGQMLWEEGRQSVRVASEWQVERRPTAMLMDRGDPFVIARRDEGERLHELF